MFIAHHLKIEASLLLSLVDQNDNGVLSFDLNLSAKNSTIDPHFQQPVVISVPSGTSVDFFFLNNNAVVYSILASSTSERTLYQLYDDNDAQIRAGAVGKNFAILNTECYPGTQQFDASTPANGEYLKITNKDTVVINVTVFVLGTVKQSAA